MNPVSVLFRFLEWRGKLLIPRHVEKADRKGYWKRVAWIGWSSTISLLTAYAVVSIPAALLDLHSVAAGAGAFVLWFYLDYHLFRWGLDRFGIVVPWQFRDVDVNEEGETDD